MFANGGTKRAYRGLCYLSAFWRKRHRSAIVKSTATPLRVTVAVPLTVSTRPIGCCGPARPQAEFGNSSPLSPKSLSGGYAQRCRCSASSSHWCASSS
jgi:hypothetical protein